jgi:hypothetical protein
MAWNASLRKQTNTEVAMMNEIENADGNATAATWRRAMTRTTNNNSSYHGGSSSGGGDDNENKTIPFLR